MSQKSVIAATLGECVLVAGVTNFLRLAEAAGWLGWNILESEESAPGRPALGEA